MNRRYSKSAHVPFGDTRCGIDPSNRFEPNVLDYNARVRAEVSHPFETLLERRWRELRTSRQLGVLLLAVLALTALAVEGLS